MQQRRVQHGRKSDLQVAVRERGQRVLVGDDLALLGEAMRVAKEVHQDLTKPERIADDGVGDIRLDVEDQIEPLRMVPGGEAAHGVADHLAKAEVGDFKLELAGFDL